MNVVELIAYGHFVDLLPYIYIMLSLWAAAVLAVLVDLWSGVDRARVLGEKIESNGFRRTIVKMGDYWRVQVMAAIIDVIASILPWYDHPYVSMVIALGVVFIECRSVWENSQAKKSAAGNIPDILRDIVNCVTTHDAKNLLEHIRYGYDYEDEREGTGPDQTV